MSVTLTWDEVETVAIVGVRRSIAARSKGWRQRFEPGRPKTSQWEWDIGGALGEYAVAKALGLPWDERIGLPGPGDVGHLEVRTTRWRNGRLILHPEDQDKALFLLVVGEPPTFRLVGWIWARDGKRDDYWEEGKSGQADAFFVPQQEGRRIGPCDACGKRCQRQRAHLIPKSRGGDDRYNVCLLCARCHRQQEKRTEVFIEECGADLFLKAQEHTRRYDREKDLYAF
jgi:hypothetical protein